MLNAFRYGAPPHGGAAPGVDRIVMLLADGAQYPRGHLLSDESAGDGPDDGRTNEVPAEKLRELHIGLRLPPPRKD